jgi:hypothetical protein
MSLTAISASVAGEQPQSKQDQKAEIAVSLAVTRNSFVVGETIEVRVEIRNAGDTSIFVGRELYLNTDWIHSLELSLEDESGNASGYMRSGRDKFPPDPEQSIATSLAKGWIALSPGHFYGTTLRIYPQSFEFLQKPGRYRLYGKYVSHGVDAPFYYNPLAYKVEAVSQLPYRFWKGEIDTNSVWIEIVSQNSSAKE